MPIYSTHWALKKSSVLFVVGVPAVAAGKEDGDLGEYRNKLLSFLDISTSYEPARLISDFPFDGKSRSYAAYKQDIACVCLIDANKVVS